MMAIILFPRFKTCSGCFCNSAMYLLWLGLPSVRYFSGQSIIWDSCPLLGTENNGHNFRVFPYAHDLPENHNIENHTLYLRYFFDVDFIDVRYDLRMKRYLICVVRVVEYFSQFYLPCCSAVPSENFSILFFSMKMLNHFSIVTVNHTSYIMWFY